MHIENLVFRSICTTFDLTVEGTLVRENSKNFWFSSHLFVPLTWRSKVGFTSEKQILFKKFGFSLSLHYLCSRNGKQKETTVGNDTCRTEDGCAGVGYACFHG